MGTEGVNGGREGGGVKGDKDTWRRRGGGAAGVERQEGCRGPAGQEGKERGCCNTASLVRGRPGREGAGDGWDSARDKGFQCQNVWVQ